MIEGMPCMFTPHTLSVTMWDERLHGRLQQYALNMEEMMK